MSDLSERLMRCWALIAEPPPQAPDLLNVLRDAADRIEYLESVAGAVSASDALDKWREMRKQQQDRTGLPERSGDG